MGATVHHRRHHDDHHQGRRPPRRSRPCRCHRSPRVGDSVSLVPRPAVDRSPPARLIIEDIGVDHPVRDVALEDDGQLEIPDETEVGWYRLGSAPGERGATVIAGHLSWNGQRGPFLELSQLELDAELRIELANGSARRYAVVERAQYPKLMLPADRIWTRTGPERLVLITCGGEFNPDIHRYHDNIVVYARPQP